MSLALCWVNMYNYDYFFFFSSRRRHTRWNCDWSSDVCSSDLYWQGVQLDETALPVVLAAELEERDALRSIAVEDMVRRALGYIARTGPSTMQDRWEENEGINAFTLATTI